MPEHCQIRIHVNDVFKWIELTAAPSHKEIKERIEANRYHNLDIKGNVAREEALEAKLKEVVEQQGENIKKVDRAGTLYCELGYSVFSAIVYLKS